MRQGPQPDTFAEPSAQNVLLSATSITDNEELLGVVLPPDQFFIRIYGVSGDINTYTLQVTATVGGGLLPDVFEPNDDPVAVCALPVQAGSPNFGDLSGQTWLPNDPPT